MILHPKTHIDTLKHPQTPPNTARGSTTMIQDTPQPVPKKTDVLAKKVDFSPFWPFSVAFRYFPLLRFRYQKVKMTVGVVKSTLEDHCKLSFYHLPD